MGSKKFRAFTSETNLIENVFQKLLKVQQLLFNIFLGENKTERK